ncbi:PBECR3 domain-containing polyvalent protein [Helicobacter sp. 'CLO3_human']|nr:hypothetical protein [Helicobacter sp. 'CLO3_human']
MQYGIFKRIEQSPKYGSKMDILGAQNCNAKTLEFVLLKNKRIAVSNLAPQIAQKLGFKYPNDVHRTIQPDEIIHTLTRHGADSDLVKKSRQKAVTLDEISKWMDYADNADIQGLSKDKSGNEVLVSAKQLDNGYYVVIEQIRKGQNELSYKNMYFENGIVDESVVGRKIELAPQLPPKL